MNLVGKNNTIAIKSVTLLFKTFIFVAVFSFHTNALSNFKGKFIGHY